MEHQDWIRFEIGMAEARIELVTSQLKQNPDSTALQLKLADLKKELEALHALLANKSSEALGPR